MKGSTVWCNGSQTWVWVSQRGLVKTHYWAPPQSFWFRRSGVRSINVHFSQVLRWCWCCWPGSHTLRGTGSTAVPDHSSVNLANYLYLHDLWSMPSSPHPKIVHNESTVAETATQWLNLCFRLPGPTARQLLVLDVDLWLRSSKGIWAELMCITSRTDS